MVETNNNSNKISWKAPEFVHRPKTIWWFIVAFIIGTAFIVYFGFFQKDLLTSSLALLLLVFVIFFARQKPKIINIEINDSQIKIGDLTLPFTEIKSFWIAYKPPEVKTLNLETTAYLNRYVTIQLDDMNPVKVREFLLDHLPEDYDKDDEQFGDKISRKIGF